MGAQSKTGAIVHMYSGIKNKLSQKKYDEADQEFKKAENLLCQKTYQNLKNLYLKNELKRLFDEDLLIKAEKLFNEIQSREFPMDECIYKQLKKEFAIEKQQLIKQHIQDLLGDYKFEAANKLYAINKEYISKKEFAEICKHSLKNQENDIQEQINDLLNQKNPDKARAYLNENEKHLTQRTYTYLREEIQKKTNEIQILEKMHNLFRQKKFIDAEEFFQNQKIVSYGIFKSIEKDYKGKLENLNQIKEKIKTANELNSKVDPQL